MTSLPSDTFARRLRTERERKGLSQAELARQMADTLGQALDPSAVTRIEQRTRAVRLDEAVAMAQALGVPLPLLLAEEPVEELGREITERLIQLDHLYRQWTEMGEQIRSLTGQVEVLRSQQVPEP